MKGEESMIYICEVYKKKVIEAPTKEEALEKFMHLFDLGEEEVKVTCIGKGENE